MALAYVGEIAAGVGTSAAATTFPMTLTAGASSGTLVVLSWASREAANGLVLSSVADSRSNTWAVAASIFNNTGSNISAIAYSVIGTALQIGDTVTATFSGNVGTGRCFWIENFSGSAAHASVLDKTATNDASTGPPDGSGATGTLSQANEVLVACFCGLSMGYTSISPSFTLFTTGAQSASGAAQPRDGIAGYKIVGANDSVTANTNTSSGNGPGCIASFKEAAAAGASIHYAPLLGVGA